MTPCVRVSGHVDVIILKENSGSSTSGLEGSIGNFFTIRGR